MEQTEIQIYLDIAARRKWWLIISFLITLLGGVAYVMFAPRIYEAKVELMVLPQEIPEEVVRPLISSIENRITVITQQVTSRTNLEKIIHAYNLYGSSEAEMLPEEKVSLLREAIKLEPTYQTVQSSNRNITFQEICVFTISFRYEDAEKAAKVANTLASDFVSEDLKMREDHVLGTSDFLFDELESLEDKLAKKEEELKQYREKFMGGLPEQLDTNLRILERLEQQLDNRTRALREAENRKYLIQEQIAESTIINLNGEPIATDIGMLRRELASLELKYSDSHPDVIRLRKMIAKIDEEISKLGTDLEKGNLLPGMDDKLRFQFQNTVLEIKDIKTEIMETQSQIKQYQVKVEESPKREQELVIQNRDYDNLRRLYNSLFERKVQAGIVVSMERKQKGEQFRIIEAAAIPTRPVEPKVKIVIILTLALGVGLGSGLAVLKEYMDTSYKTPEEVKKDIQLPILTELPILYSEKELKGIRRKNTFAYAAVALGFVLSAAAIVIAAEGMEKTMEFVRNLIGVA